MLCSFCGREKKETQLLVAGMNAHICDSCIEQAHAMVEEEIGAAKAPGASGNIELIRPVAMKAHLDEYVIGQEAAKKILSVAVYMHY